MKKDIEIAHSTHLLPIDEVAASLGIGSDSLEHYGKHIAKLPLSLIDDRRRGKLILVTAITATKAGIGKTTVSIGLALGLNAIGRKACVALREPSLGPCFGMKGGAAGGGYAQVLPMERINLHFTGDFHAITAAHNMISALLDNYIYQHRAEGFGLKEVLWRRVLDVNDRSLRSIVTGIGPATNGGTQQAGFDITPASELMAILCLASSKDDLRRRIEQILLGYTYDGKPFTVRHLGVAGAIMTLLLEGGGELAGVALRAHAVDEVAFFIAPKLLTGRDSRPVVGGDSPLTLAEALDLHDVELSPFGPDILYSAKLGAPPQPGPPTLRP